MVTPSHVLLAIDDSEASEEATRQLAERIGAETEVHVVTVLPPLPPSLLEHGGSEDSLEEHQIEERMEDARRRWVAEAEAHMKPRLARIRDVLAHGGVPASAMETICESVDPEDRLTDVLIELARKRRCGAIAVGRHSLPWYQEVFHHHVGDTLVRRADGLEVWVLD